MAHIRSFALWLVLASISGCATGGLSQGTSSASNDTTEMVRQLLKAESTTYVDPLTVAPPLTEVGTYFVTAESDPNKFEDIKKGQTGTSHIFEGKWVLIGVYEIGYGKNESASLNGKDGRLLIKKELIQNGQVIGYVLGYQFEPFQSGSFKFEVDGQSGGGHQKTTLEVHRFWW